MPIDQPPYYCIPVYPGGATTNGGPRPRCERGEILDPNGMPIQGLFGAGELGGAIGMLYPSPGANLGEAFALAQSQPKQLSPNNSTTVRVDIIATATSLARLIDFQCAVLDFCKGVRLIPSRKSALGAELLWIGS